MSVFRSNSAVGLGVTEFGDPSELLRIAVYRQGAGLVSALEMLTPQARGLRVRCFPRFCWEGSRVQLGGSYQSSVGCGDFRGRL